MSKTKRCWSDFTLAPSEINLAHLSSHNMGVQRLYKEWGKERSKHDNTPLLRSLIFHEVKKVVDYNTISIETPFPHTSINSGEDSNTLSVTLNTIPYISGHLAMTQMQVKTYDY